VKPRNRIKACGRRDSGTFTLIPHAVQDSPNWRACSGTGIKLLCDLARQFNGRNNGDLCAALTLMKPRGWTRRETILIAARELIHYGLIVLTRQGGLHYPNLYAVTWLAIDECGGKLDHPASRVASGAWKEPKERFRRPTKIKAPVRIPDAQVTEIGLNRFERLAA
jgi:hypothetical protein